MNIKLILLAIFSLASLPSTLQIPTQFSDTEDFDIETNKISFPSTSQEVFKDDEDEADDEVDYEDERAIYEFVTDLKKKGDNPSTGTPTLKPDLTSNDLWDFNSFLNELVAQARKNKHPKIRMPQN